MGGDLPPVNFDARVHLNEEVQRTSRSQWTSHERNERGRSLHTNIVHAYCPHLT